MGKYIKGKKLPKGISRRKDDGKFMAGFVDKAGKRHQRRFDTMVEAGRWLYEMRHQDEFGDGIDAEYITFDEWFKFRHTELIEDSEKLCRAGNGAADRRDDCFDVG